MNGKVLVGISFDADTVLKIEAAAKAEARTKSGWIKWVVQKALDERGKADASR